MNIPKSPLLIHIEQTAIDAVTFKAESLFAKAGSDPDKRDKAFEVICITLSYINRAVKREDYISRFSKQFKIKPQLFTSHIASEIESRLKLEEPVVKGGDDDDFLKLPEGVDKNEFIKYGFFEDSKKGKTGYYFMQERGTGFTRVSNFIVKPLYHVYSKLDNRRIISISNDFNEESIIQIPSKACVSVDQFSGFMVEEGPNIFRGNKNQFLSVMNKMLVNLPKCYDLNTLGWQGEGFWAFSNCIYDKELQPFNEYGIAKVGERNYLSVSASSINKDVRQDEDIYQNDKYLVYKKSPIDFKEWAECFEQVYERNSWAGIAFVLVTVFKDIVVKSTKMPILYAYGPVQAGKSEFGESISNLFFSGKNADGKLMPAFNLNQGTDFAFFNRMERFKNCPNLLNEFDEDKIKEEFFRAIKGSWDGEGREKGKGISNKSTAQSINCTVIIMGQFLSTKDDGSVLGRSICLNFKGDRKFTQEQKDLFNKLKQWEDKGLSSIIAEILQYRSLVAEQFHSKFWEVEKLFSKSIADSGHVAKTRILKNYSALCAMSLILFDKLSLPEQMVNEFPSYCVKQIIELSKLISDSNALANFWKTVEFLLDGRQITYGFDLRISSENKVDLYEGTVVKEIKEFTQYKRILFLRLGNVHMSYNKYHLNKGLNEKTIEMYMREQEYYIGYTRNKKFTAEDGRSTVTTAFVLDYDKMESMGISLEREREYRNSPSINTANVEKPTATLATEATKV